jgi:hypothetical protein
MLPATLLYLASGLAGLLNMKRFSNALAWIGLGLVVGAAICGWLAVGRLPVYGQIEANLHIALVLALCMAFVGRRPDIAAIPPWGRLVVAALLGRALIGHDGMNPDYFLYQFWSVQLFFFLRLSAGGVIVLAFILYVRSWVRTPESDLNNEAARLRAANHFLIAGAILFLGSEFSGTLWCAMGYGDTWHWTPNFLKSAVLFLLLMLPLHAPRWFKKNGRLAGVGSLCTLLVILEIVL